MRKISASKQAVIFWSLLTLGIATQYNACSQKVSFSQSLASLKEEILSTSLILINGDAPYTNDKNVEVMLQNHLADEVYVTNDPTCNSGGTWEPMQDKKAWTLSAENQEVAVYARFRNVQEGVSTGCSSDAIIHDGEKPNVLLVDPNIATNVATPIFNFLAYDALSGVKRITCQWPGKGPTECNYSSSNGNLSEGVYLIGVVPEDIAGNIGDPVMQSIIVDRTPPTVILNRSPAAVTGNANSEFEFTGTDNLSGIKNYECSKEDLTHFVACVSPLAWTVTEGPHKLYIRATDNAGNTSTPIVSDFSLDMSAPTVRILTGPPDFSNSKSATFTFDGMDSGKPISKFECHIDANAFVACASPSTSAGLVDGTHVFYVRGVDGVGLKSAPEWRTWVVDTVGPTVALTQTPSAVTNMVVGNFKYTISDVGSGVASAQCSIDNGAFANCDMAMYTATGLIEGAHIFKVRGIDKAGNEGAAVSFSWKVDRTLPLLTLNSGPGAYTNTADATFVYTATDAGSGIARVECRLDAAVYAPCDSVTTHHLTGLTEGGRKMLIRAVDIAGNYSTEVTVNWIVDLNGPVISYFQQPVPVILSTYLQSLGFTVADASSGVNTVACTLNGVASACVPGQKYTFPAMSAGIYTYVITATDKAGNVSTSTKVWEVKAATVKTQVVDVQTHNKVDIVVIIDNSGSMVSEMANMGEHFSSFISQLNGLDWQVGIITTDPTAGDAKKVDGRLVELSNMNAGTYILKSSMDEAAANLSFKNTIQMPNDGSGDERGIYTAVRSIKRGFDGLAINAANAAMFRPDAVLAFVVVTDATDGKSVPEDLINEVKAHWNGQKVFSFHSLVVPESAYTHPAGGALDAADPCKNYRESVAYDGRVYETLSTMTGGIKGTECTSDYSTQLKNMAKATVDLVTAATLQCVPVDANSDGVVDYKDLVITTAAGQNFTAFTVAGDKLTFTTALPPGQNTVSYTCLQ